MNYLHSSISACVEPLRATRLFWDYSSIKKLRPQSLIGRYRILIQNVVLILDIWAVTFM